MIVVIAATLGGGGSGGGSTTGSSHSSHAASGHAKANAPKTYVVENGDTLTSIAHETGVPVATILKLNPGIDPQILVSGERLKLK